MYATLCEFPQLNGVRRWQPRYWQARGRAGRVPVLRATFADVPRSSLSPSVLPLERYTLDYYKLRDLICLAVQPLNIAVLVRMCRARSQPSVERRCAANDAGASRRRHMRVSPRAGVHSIWAALPVSERECAEDPKNIRSALISHDFHSETARNT